MISVVVQYLLVGLVSVILFTIFMYIEALGRQRDGEPISLYSLWDHGEDSFEGKMPAPMIFIGLFVFWWSGWAWLALRAAMKIFALIGTLLAPAIHHPLPAVKRKNVETAREALETMTLEELTEVTNDLLGERREQLSDLLQHHTRS